MPHRFRFAAIHLALAAMLLRALLPVGWMPSQNGAALILCTMDGVVHDAGDPAHKPAQDEHRDECPFAAAPHLATPIAVEIPLQPSYQIAFVNIPAASHSALQTAAYAPQSPRAPPLTV